MVYLYTGVFGKKPLTQTGILTALNIVNAAQVYTASLNAGPHDLSLYIDNCQLARTVQIQFSGSEIGLYGMWSVDDRACRTGGVEMTEYRDWQVEVCIYLKCDLHKLESSLPAACSLSSLFI